MCICTFIYVINSTIKYNLCNLLLWVELFYYTVSWKKARKKRLIDYFKNIYKCTYFFSFGFFIELYLLGGFLFSVFHRGGGGSDAMAPRRAKDGMFNHSVDWIREPRSWRWIFLHGTFCESPRATETDRPLEGFPILRRKKNKKRDAMSMCGCKLYIYIYIHM